MVPPHASRALPALVLPVLLLAVACAAPAAGGHGPAPTPTPTPVPPSQGVHTPEDLRAHLAALPEADRLVVDDDVQVRFAPAWYATTALWVGAAFVYHVPSLSSVTLDLDGEVTRRRIHTEEARERLEAVLADEAVMGEVRRRLLARTYHPDWPVFQYQRGGVLAPSSGAEMVPDITVWGDGRAVFVAEDGTVRQGRLAPDAVVRIVAAAVALHELEDPSVAVAATDLPTASFSVYTVRGRRTVSAYGMDPARALEGEQHPEVLERLRAVYRAAVEALPEEAPVLEPEEVVVHATPAEGATPVGEWPAHLVGHLHGDAARAAARLGGVGPAAVFLLDGRPHRVTVAPVLPLLHLPSTTWPQGGLPRLPSAIAYSAPGTPYRYDQTWPSDAARFYRAAMPERGWTLAREEEDALQVWVRRRHANDPVVVLRFHAQHLEVALLAVHDGVPRHPEGVLGGCAGAPCELVRGASAREVRAWFREHLGYLGWTEAGPDTYERDGWRLRLTFQATREGVEVRHERSPLQPTGWPPPPTPTPAA